MVALKPLPKQRSKSFTEAIKRLAAKLGEQIHAQTA